MASLRLGLLILLWFILPYTAATNVEPHESWTHIGTLWDALGNLGSISPNSRYVTVSQGDTTRLVQIETGSVIAQVDHGRFDFSPTDAMLLNPSTTKLNREFMTLRVERRCRSMVTSANF